MPKTFEIEKLADSMATISEIIWRRLKCMECNQCEPCGEAFMNALNVIRKAGTVSPNVARKAGSAAER